MFVVLNLSQQIKKMHERFKEEGKDVSSIELIQLGDFKLIEKQLFEDMHDKDKAIKELRVKKSKIKFNKEKVLYTAEKYEKVPILPIDTKQEEKKVDREPKVQKIEVDLN